MNKKLNSIARQISALSSIEQKRIITAKDDGELSQVLQELGIIIPSSTWWLKLIKAVIYFLGLLLAGVGTSAAAQSLIHF